jgi:hypothetical protein
VNGPTTTEAEISPPRRQANATRAASGPSIKLLSPPTARPDAVFGPGGKLRARHGYDLGLAAPMLLPDAPGRAVQALGLADTIEHTLQFTLGVFPSRKELAYGVRRLLGWLDRFNGDTWEERWLASGAELAPTSWREAVEPQTVPSALRVAASALIGRRGSPPQGLDRPDAGRGWPGWSRPAVHRRRDSVRVARG